MRSFLDNRACFQPHIQEPHLILNAYSSKEQVQTKKGKVIFLRQLSQKLGTLLELIHKKDLEFTYKTKFLTGRYG